jgi:predicted nucleic acid-binding protein
MLVDTDVIIWHLRGLAAAVQRLDQIADLQISSITYMEVLQGLRNKDELQAVKKMLSRRAAVLLPPTPTITHKAIELLEGFTLSHGLQMGDALIAATAIEHQLSLLTCNIKHFKFIPDLNSIPFSLTG